MVRAPPLPTPRLTGSLPLAAKAGPSVTASVPGTAQEGESVSFGGIARELGWAELALSYIMLYVHVRG